MVFKVINHFQCMPLISSDKMQRVFLVIPLISAVAFLPSLLSASSTQRKFIALLSISSLLCTAYILFFQPKSEATGKRMNTRAPPGPLLQHGPYLNGVLSLLIGLSSLMMDDKAMDHDGFWLLCLLPVGKYLSHTSVVRRPTYATQWFSQSPLYFSIPYIL